VDATVSVVVPVYNQAVLIAQALASLFAQDYPPSRFEIIVVDDGSTDGSGDAARHLGETWSGVTRVLAKPNGGPASARNLGVARSQAEFVAFMDADCRAAPNWLSSLVWLLTKTNAAAVGGPIVNAASSNLVASYIEASGLYRHRAHRGVVDYLLTANVAFRRSALLEMDGFSEGAWAEDADLSFRLRAAGHTLLLADDGIVMHYGSPTTVRALARELYRYGSGSYAQSRQWAGKRTPLREFIRHAGAVALSPALALRLAPRLGLARACGCWPLVVIEHSAFCGGLLAGRLSASTDKRSDDRRVVFLSRRV
jgi:glycosyltransferase involved in cell wall biosynthesis